MAAIWRGAARTELKAATTAAAVLLATPYTFVYDGPILGLGIVFLLRDATRQDALTVAEAALLAGSLAGQTAFLFVSNSLVTPGTALALLTAALLRATRTSASTACQRAQHEHSGWRLPGYGVGGGLRAAVEGQGRFAPQGVHERVEEVDSRLEQP